jgi:hypothetical protein
MDFKRSTTTTTTRQPTDDRQKAFNSVDDTFYISTNSSCTVCTIYGLCFRLTNCHAVPYNELNIAASSSISQVRRDARPHRQCYCHNLPRAL